MTELPTRAGKDTGGLDELTTELDQEITEAGMRGNVLPGRVVRRHRTTRRRQDARTTAPAQGRGPDDRQDVTAPDGKGSAVDVRHAHLPQLRPGPGGRQSGRSGRLRLPAGGPRRAAFRGAVRPVHSELAPVPRLRRAVFAAVEPQRRLAPHIHLAMRGTVSRADLRRVLAATYHQVWWPNATDVRFDGEELAVWDEQTATYVDPATGEVLPTWDDALMPSAQDEPCTSRGSVNGSTPKACSPGPRTRTGVSAI